MSKLAMTGLPATQEKVKHFVAERPATRPQRVNGRLICGGKLV